MTRPVLAADVGGTQMRAALVDDKGRVLLRRSVPTPAEADVPALLTDLIASVAAERGHGAASHAVVGLPGAVDYDTGRLLWAPHLPARWPDLLSADGLSEHLGLAVEIANDADLAAVGEAWFGAGAASHAVGYLTISTGIGAGVVHGGRLLRGPRSLAEVGHAVIEPHIQTSSSYLFLFIATAGTTITPFMQLYVQSAVVECVQRGVLAPADQHIGSYQFVQALVHEAVPRGYAGQARV